MKTPATSFVFPHLSRWHKTRLLNHAARVLETQQKMSSDPYKNIVHYTLNDDHQHLSGIHYPKGDRIDFSTGAQYFYHCHREDMDTEEHGHFHCFIRYEKIPRRIGHLYPPDVKNHTHPPMSHLVAIAMNRYGQPIRLFAVNQWVSSEIWYDGEHAEWFTRRFRMTLSDNPYWQVLDTWVSGMIQLFAPQIHWLLCERSRVVAAASADASMESVFNDESLEELASIPIDLTQQIHWILKNRPQKTGTAETRTSSAGFTDSDDNRQPAIPLLKV